MSELGQIRHTHIGRGGGGGQVMSVLVQIRHTLYKGRVR